MRIPHTGDDMLFCIDEGSAEFKKPAIYRPGHIISVASYSPDSAIIGANIDLDPFTDKSWFPEGFTPRTDMAMIAFKNNLQYSKTPKKGCWCYFEDVYSMEHGINIEQITVDGEITHGREIIRDEAIGIWDQMRNTVSFKREDVQWKSGEGTMTELPADMDPVYAADDFIDLHISRLAFPEGYRTVFKQVFSDGSKERADERRQFIRNYGRAASMGLDASRLSGRQLSGRLPKGDVWKEAMDLMQKAWDLMMGDNGPMHQLANPPTRRDRQLPGDEKQGQEKRELQHA
jgi:hypothetical protein